MSGDFLSGVPIRPPVRQTEPVKRDAAVKSQTATTSFSQVLTKVQAETGLKFSAHAMARMQDRGVQLSDSDVAAIGQVVQQMASKGTKDAYLFYGSDGFVVNVPNRTVVTAMAHDSTKIITNVDSVAIIPRHEQ